MRRLIRAMAREGWGAPRIYGTLMKLGCVESEITVSRYMPCRPVDSAPVKRWIAFLRNHKDAIAAMDWRNNDNLQLQPRALWYILLTRTFAEISNHTAP